MPTPRDDPRILLDWQAYRDRRTRENANLWQVCRELAERYDCAPITVRYHIDQSYQERKMEADRAKAARRYARLKHKRAYEKQYRRITRHPGEYLARVFESRGQAEINTIVAEFRSLADDLPFTSRLITRLLRKYETDQRQGRARGPPWLREAEPGIWAYNDKVLPYPTGPYDADPPDYHGQDAGETEST